MLSKRLSETEAGDLNSNWFQVTELSQKGFRKWHSIRWSVSLTVIEEKNKIKKV